MPDTDTGPETRFDWDREQRTGLPEIVLAASKSPAQIADILTMAAAREHGLLISRLDGAQHQALVGEHGFTLDYDPVSRTARFGAPPKPAMPADIAIVCAGTSDVPVAREAQRALEWFGYDAPLFSDVGVAGLWRILSIADELKRCRVVIAVAGMEGALFSVVGGLVSGLVVAVPTSVGYGVSEGGKAALSSALASCAPGIVTVNIDNGIGAAAAARKVMLAMGGDR